jgi:hypothetical protein
VWALGRSGLGQDSMGRGWRDKSCPKLLAAGQVRMVIVASGAWLPSKRHGQWNASGMTRAIGSLTSPFWPSPRAAQGVPPCSDRAP